MIKSTKLTHNLAKLTLVAVLFSLTSCFDSYTERTKYELQNMKEPIILKKKKKMTFWYGVTLQDARGDIYKWGNGSSLANSIGELYEVNDTIPK